MAEQSGVDLDSVALLLVNKGFELHTAGDYTGLLGLHDEADLQAQVRQAQQQMPATLLGAAQTLALRQEPRKHQPGDQCTSPFECPYIGHCTEKTTGKTAKQTTPQPVPIRFYNDRGGAKAQTLIDAGHTDPRRALAEQLVKDIAPRCTVLAWNDSFERTVIRDLVEQFADLRQALVRIHDQVQDLLPIVQRHYFHPDMAQAEGSTFSIKTVLPCMAAHLQYSQLGTVQNGSEAQLAYLLAAAPPGAEKEPGQAITPAERQQARKDLLAYCGLDTEAMVEIVKSLK